MDNEIKAEEKKEVKAVEFDCQKFWNYLKTALAIGIGILGIGRATKDCLDNKDDDFAKIDKDALKKMLKKDQKKE